MYLTAGDKPPESPGEVSAGTKQVKRIYVWLERVFTREPFSFVPVLSSLPITHLLYNVNSYKKPTGMLGTAFNSRKFKPSEHILLKSVLNSFLMPCLYRRKWSLSFDQKLPVSRITAQRTENMVAVNTAQLKAQVICVTHRI